MKPDFCHKNETSNLWMRPTAGSSITTIFTDNIFYRPIRVTCFRFSIKPSLVLVCIKVLVFSYIFMPVPDDGFTEKPKTCGTFWTIKYIARKYACDLRWVYLF